MSFGINMCLGVCVVREYACVRYREWKGKSEREKEKGGGVDATCNLPSTVCYVLNKRWRSRNSGEVPSDRNKNDDKVEK